MRVGDFSWRASASSEDRRRLRLARSCAQRQFRDHLPDQRTLINAPFGRRPEVDPAVEREIPASRAAARKPVNRRDVKLRDSAIRSVNALAPNCTVSTSAAADYTECPDGYSGNGGVLIGLGQSGRPSTRRA